jgi:hypothetical protein
MNWSEASLEAGIALTRCTLQVMMDRLKKAFSL